MKLSTGKDINPAPRWARTIKIGLVSGMVATPTYFVLDAWTSNSGEGRSPWGPIIALGLALVAPIVFGGGVRTKWGILIAGPVLFALSLRFWLDLLGPGTQNEELRGLAYFPASLLLTLIAAAAALVDQAIIFWRPADRNDG